MVFDEAGTYTIEYTATDECGNTTNAERTVIVEAPPTYRTVLYTDGTFIINESSRDEAANVQAHGQPTNVYDPFNPNGATNQKKYIFANYSARPWGSQVTSITSVEIGSNISPTSMSYWFYGMTNCVSMDLSKLNTSLVTSMIELFYNCKALASIDLRHFNTSLVTRMDEMFRGCDSLTALDLSNFDTSSVQNMSHMFRSCDLLEQIDLDGFDTSNVTNMTYMFQGCKIQTIDLSSFDTSSLTNTSNMFNGCKSLETIYVSENFVTDQVNDSSLMFNSMSSNLVGGAGTVWSSSNPVDATYARIDNPPDAPGYFTAKN